MVAYQKKRNRVSQWPSSDVLMKEVRSSREARTRKSRSTGKAVVDHSGVDRPGAIKTTKLAAPNVSSSSELSAPTSQVLAPLMNR